MRDPFARSISISAAGASSSGDKSSHSSAATQSIATTSAKRPDIVSGTASACARKHSVIVGGRKTSVCLDPQAWQRLCALATRRRVSVTALIETIEDMREGRNRSRAIRAFVEAQRFNERFGHMVIGERRTHPPKPPSTDDILIG